jgi:hypothetical protein
MAHTPKNTEIAHRLAVQLKKRNALRAQLAVTQDDITTLELELLVSVEEDNDALLAYTHHLDAYKYLA